jgi:hypothetical protein
MTAVRNPLKKFKHFCVGRRLSYSHYAVAVSSSKVVESDSHPHSLPLRSLLT